MGRKTGSHSELTRPRIAKAALTLFARHGYAAVSMRQIAASVGVQVGALYLYTPDKQTLLFDLLTSHMEELLAAWKDEYQSEDPVTLLEAFVRFHIRFNLARPEAVFLSYMELRNLEPENLQRITDLRKSYENILEEVLERGRVLGAFRLRDPKLTTLAVIAMLTGITNWYRDDGRLDLEVISDTYWEMVRGIVCP